MMRTIRGTWAVVLVLALILGACGDDDGSAAETGGSNNNGEATSTSSGSGDDPQKGEHDPEGTLRIGFLFVPTSLDPHSERHIGDRHALHPIWDTLVKLANDRSVVPHLAESWVFGEDGTSLTFTLRDDVAFHDGTPLTADAARLSIERLLTDDAVTPSVRNAIADVQSVSAPDDQTLVVTLSRPNAAILPAFATMAGAVINPEYIDTDLTVPPPEASSGPYVVTDHVPDASVSYERAPTVWHPDAGRVKNLVIESYTDVQAGLNALESGALDMAFGRVEVEVLDGIQARNDGFQFVQIPAGPGVVLRLRNSRAPLDNKAIRQAIMHAIDHDAIAEHGVGNHCVPTNQWAPEGTPGYIPGFDAFPYDPEAARALVEESGVGSPSVELMVATDQEAEGRSAQIIQQMLADVGVNVEIVPVAFAEGPARWIEGNDDMYLNATAANYDLGDALYQTLFGAGILAGSEADDYIDAIEAALAPGDDREDRLQEAHKVALESALAMPFCFQTSRWLANDKVIGLEDLALAWTGIFDPSYLAVR